MEHSRTSLPPKLIDFEAEEVEQARSMTFAEKFLAGPELFDFVEQISSGGIRMQHPDFTEEQVHAEFLRRINLDTSGPRR